MAASEDFEELCARLRTIVEREDLGNDEKVASLRELLLGATRPDAAPGHAWRETGSLPLPATGDGGSQGQSVQYACTRCGARGYQIVFPTSVTMYPIVTDDPQCPA